MTKMKSAEDVREDFLDTIREIALFWASLPEKTDIEKCKGTAFSILNIFDGTHGYLPAMDIVLSPHESDKDYNISQGEDWYEKGMVINDCMLHELFYKSER